MTVLRNLKTLHDSMRSVRMARALFDWTHNGEVFRVVFITDDPDVDSHMVLMFTHGTGRPSFEKPVEVLTGGAYAIRELFFDEPGVFDELRALFRTGRDSGHHLIPKELFEEFDKAIPTSAAQVRRPEPHEMLLRRDVEEADKIYFCGWRTYPTSGRRPSPENLWKTRVRCGEVAWKRCVKSHISSRWSDLPEKQVKYTPPREDDLVD